MPNLIFDATFTKLLADQYRHYFAQEILEGAELMTKEALNRALFAHPLAILAHGNESDPIFCYANQSALSLFERDEEEFTLMASRHSACLDDTIQSDRQSLLKKALEIGAISDYQGVRQSKTGKKFLISETRLWTLKDDNGQKIGQAALIGRFSRL